LRRGDGGAAAFAAVDRLAGRPVGGLRCPSRNYAATECGDREITDPEEQRKVLWRMLFRTPYNQSEPIRAQMNVKIQAGLAQFLQQWHAWKAEIEQQAWDKANSWDAKPSGKNEDVGDIAKDVANDVGQFLHFEPSGVRYLRFKEQLKKENPFRPTLSFAD
jgi:hypothetical protein